jgi:hypothetical protein
MLKDQSSSVKESKMAYYISENKSSRAIAAMLHLVSDLENKVEEVKKENRNIREQLIGLENSVDLLKKQKAATDRPLKKSP